MKKRPAARIVVVDAQGREVPSGRPSAVSQVFDVTAARLQIGLLAGPCKHFGRRHGAMDLGQRWP